MMKRAFLIAVGAVSLVATACKKDDNGKKASTKDLLTSTTWTYDTVTLDLDKNGIPDTAVPAEYLSSCDFDNTITFKSDMTGIYDQGADKCEDTIPQTTNFTWSLKNGDSTLTVNGVPDQQLNGDVQIKTLTNASLVLIKSVEITDPITISANLIITLKK